MRKISLEPLGFLVSATFSVSFTFLATGAALTVYGLFHGDVCFDVTSSMSDVVLNADKGPVAGLHAAVTTSVQELRVCLTEPSGAQRALGLLLSAPTSICYVIGLYLLLTLLRRADQEGVHTDQTAGRVRRLGYYLLISVPVATLLESFARTALLRIASVAAPEALVFIGDWHFPSWAVFTGLGMVVLSRIMRASAEMREELEGTV